MEKSLKLAVGLIGWSQDSISDVFGDGEDDMRAVDALRSLNLNDRMAIIATYPTIRVVQSQSYGYITLDKRYLLLFRKVLPPTTEIAARIASATEAAEFTQNFMTYNEGATFVVRANRL
ncbi:hypothetical protein FRC08_014115 [Ceratobasidium sp. 394]|nr:hypothetical protein FRC08_014115 [Ceratobasidium sp. 394]KAG9086357.1 hypothetical protein FS749_003693 [Ceratobasidium sp. UAMH 11750]